MVARAAHPALHALAARERGLDFDPTTNEGYDALWRWSCDDLAAFWRSIWDHFGIVSPTPHARCWPKRRCPARVWFPGAQVNYAQQCSRHADAAHAAGHPAIVFRDEAMQRAGAHAGDRLARAAPPGRRRSPRRCAAGRRARRPRRRVPAQRAARRWSRSSPAPASARSGRCARPTWARSRCSTAFARSSPRC